MKTFSVRDPVSQTLVSILVPVYNSGRFLKETIESLLAQTYRDIEVVLLDDASSDDSMRIAEWFARSDPRIVILPRHERNLGVVATRSELLYHARGAYIAWNDSDDVSKPTRIERQVAFLNRHPDMGAVGTGIIYADEKLNPISAESFPSDPGQQRVDPRICCATLLARREAAGDAGPFREAFRAGGEDGDWLLRMADRHNITNIPNHLYVYRRHKSSLTHTHDKTWMVVRLGVLARAAARVRRCGLPDPIDNLDPACIDMQLSASGLLVNPILSPDEILTGLSHVRKGELPALSVGVHPVPGPAHLAELIAAYEAQSLPSLELLLAAAPADVPVLERTAATAKIAVRAVAFDPMGNDAWEALIRAARAPYFLFAPAAGLRPSPWKVHEILRLVLNARNAPAIMSSDSRWSFGAVRAPQKITADMLRRGRIPGLVVGTRPALALLSSKDTQQELAPLRVDNTFFDILTSQEKARRRAVALMERVRRRVGSARARIKDYSRSPRQFAAVVVYRHVGARIFNNPVGRAMMSSPRLDGVKSFLRRILIQSKAPVPHPTDALAPTFEIDYASAARQATLKVAVHESWGDFEDSLRYMTPHSSALWGGVLFAPASAVPDPDFALILNTPPQDSITLRLPPQRIWFAIGEPPTVPHRILHEGQGEGTVVLTCDQSFEEGAKGPRRYIHTPVMTRTWHVKRTLEELATLGAVDKPKRLSWITSNLRTLEGHRRRMDFLDKLKTHVDFDLFGRGFQPIHDKWDAIAPYRYSIAFENTIAPLYFTEKLMDCFVCQTLPFYYGSPDILRHFPEKSVVLFDPEDPAVFDRLRDIAASDLWKERQDALAEARHLVLYKYNMYRRLADLMVEAAAGEVAAPVELTIERRVAL